VRGRCDAEHDNESDQYEDASRHPKRDTSRVKIPGNQAVEPFVRYSHDRSVKRECRRHCECVIR
jgi:hypothetical protein